MNFKFCIILLIYYAINAKILQLENFDITPGIYIGLAFLNHSDWYTCGFGKLCFGGKIGLFVFQVCLFFVLHFLINTLSLEKI